MAVNLVALVAALLMVPIPAAVQDPAFTNRILTASPLELPPGGSGDVAFNLTNPYDGTMANVVLGIEIYRYISGSDRRDVDGTWPVPRFVDTNSPSVRRAVGAPIPPGSAGAEVVRFAVATDPRGPHGGIFSQGTYLVRLRLEFDLQGGSLPGSYIMVSPGYFTLAQWNQATRNATEAERVAYRFVGNANYTYLGSLLGLPAIDGLLPDYAFGVKDPMPLWPFYGLGAVAAILAGAGTVAFALERPGLFPPLDRLAARLRRRVR